MIDKLDIDKYIVIKAGDLKFLNTKRKKDLAEVRQIIEDERKKIGKQPSKYLVLNLNDKIDINYLVAKLIGEKPNLDNDESYEINIIKIKEIAIDIINAILYVQPLSELDKGD